MRQFEAAADPGPKEWWATRPAMRREVDGVPSPFKTRNANDLRGVFPTQFVVQPSGCLRLRPGQTEVVPKRRKPSLICVSFDSNPGTAPGAAITAYSCQHRHAAVPFDFDTDHWIAHWRWARNSCARDLESQWIVIRGWGTCAV